MVTRMVADLLGELKLNVREIHSRKPQSYRTRVSDEFRKSKGLILVTSDVSARGVDYPDVTLVIQVMGNGLLVFPCHIFEIMSSIVTNPPIPFFLACQPCKTIGFLLNFSRERLDTLFINLFYSIWMFLVFWISTQNVQLYFIMVIILCNYCLQFQVGLPSDREQYIHRLGRTGRKGKEGQGILLLAPWEEFFLSTIKDLPILKAPVPSVDPDTKKKVK